METNIEKLTETDIERLARLERELAEVRKSLESKSSPNVDYGQYYRKRGYYYVVIRAFGTYILANLAYGTHWELKGADQDKLKEELSRNDFEYVGTHADYLKAIR